MNDQHVVVALEDPERVLISRDFFTPGAGTFSPCDWTLQTGSKTNLLSGPCATHGD
jgi:hypothetical protein